MVVDTSAVVAIMTGESGADELTAPLAEARAAFISTATVVELAMALESRVPTAAAGSTERFLREAGVEIIALDAAQAQQPGAAVRSTAGRGHPHASACSVAGSVGLLVG
jgi:ribonuclease VapC